MESTVEIGRRGEGIAAEFLQGCGMRVVERNWRWNHKEIDLIAEDDRLHIVEVKCLNAPAVIAPEEKVDFFKQRNLASAANHYVFSSHTEKEVQIDIVAITFSTDGTYSLEYIPEAFIPIFYNV